MCNYIPVFSCCLRNKAPLRLTANKAGEDVTGSTQTCTLVGYNFKNCAVPGFDTIGFRTTVTKCVVMFCLGPWCHLEHSGDVAALCDVIGQGVYKVLRKGN